MSNYLDFDPPYFDPNYEITVLRAPLNPTVRLPKDWFHNVQGPIYGSLLANAKDNDLTRQMKGEPIGTRVIIIGRVTDSDMRPIPNALIEIWQANAAGRYQDPVDLWGFPLDPNFYGAGRCLTDVNGNYKFTTIRPGAYPTIYHDGIKAWRAAHIHFSVFGPGFESRLITQMYFEGDPLLRQDQMLLAIPDKRGQEKLIAKMDEAHSVVDLDHAGALGGALDDQGRLNTTELREGDAAPEQRNQSAVAFRFDIVLRGGQATPMETNS